MVLIGMIVPVKCLKVRHQGLRPLGLNLGETLVQNVNWRFGTVVEFRSPGDPVALQLG